MQPKERYSSVSDMVKSVSDDAQFAEAFDARVSGRQLIKQLFALRCAKGMSQGDIAERMKCSQSRISKLESSNDGDLRLEDLEQYTSALGLVPILSLASRGRTIADEVKDHALVIKRLMEQMVKLAHGDEVIAKAVAEFHGEAFFNLINILQQSAAKLPKRPDGETPYLKIEMHTRVHEPSLDVETPDIKLVSNESFDRAALAAL